MAEEVATWHISQGRFDWALVAADPWAYEGYNPLMREGTFEFLRMQLAWTRSASIRGLVLYFQECADTQAYQKPHPPCAMPAPQRQVYTMGVGATDFAGLGGAAVPELAPAIAAYGRMARAAILER